MEENENNSSEQSNLKSLQDLNVKELVYELKKFLVEIFDIRQGVHYDDTIEGIKKDIPFQGHTAWILIFSILIASIGLNTNSTAVVIGAMLISPLMGPILGIGLSIGINDLDTFKRSLINFGVMVLLSITTAFIYFRISPFRIPSNEILNRTEPTLLDVLIAFVGGLAGIVAGSRKEKSNAIPGVAIATALMPPLCTAGFGLATGHYDFFFGALYLFGINTFFIALSTYFGVKYLRFPLARYATAAQRKKNNRIIAFVGVVIIAPSIYFFIEILNRTLYENQANTFIETEVLFDGAEVVKTNVSYEEKEVIVYMIGDIVPEKTITVWQQKLGKDDRLEGSTIVVKQGEDKSEEIAKELSSRVKEGLLQDLYYENRILIKQKDSIISKLNQQLVTMETAVKKTKIPVLELAKEVKINYPNLVSFSHAFVTETDLKHIDGIDIFYVDWDKDISIERKTENIKKLKEWLQFKLKLEELEVRNK